MRNNFANVRGAVLDVETARVRLVGGIVEGGGMLTLACRVRLVGVFVGLSSSSSLMESTRRREGRRPVARDGSAEGSRSDLSVRGTGRRLPRWPFSCL